MQHLLICIHRYTDACCTAISAQIFYFIFCKSQDYQNLSFSIESFEHNLTLKITETETTYFVKTELPSFKTMQPKVYKKGKMWPKVCKELRTPALDLFIKKNVLQLCYSATLHFPRLLD
jgi:hypothetical protein